VLYLICPHCGRRSVEEFRYGEIPTIPDGLLDADERDVDRGFMRTNPFGPTIERWFHEFGCRRWFTVERDTARDEVI
jgi:heterotetrameric sarcosine oxidase delta subunit